MNDPEQAWEPVEASREREMSPLRPLDVALIFIASLTLFGGFLLLSAAESLSLVDGAIEWRAESPLRAVVQLLCLDYRFPTINAGDIKGYIHGMGVGLSLAAIAIALLVKPAGADSPTPFDPSDESRWDSRSTPRIAARRGEFVTPITAAKLLAGMLLLWSFAGSRWSVAPIVAIGASILLTMHYGWSLALGVGLRPRAAVIVARILILVTVVAALISIWYYYGRNPTLRAKFPFGNPTFLAACLIPGIVLAVAHGFGCIAEWNRRKDAAAASAATIAGLVVAIVPCTWAFALADSRGAQIGLGVALLAIPFFALPGRKKLIVILLAGVFLSLVSWFYFTSSAESRTGRGDSLRLRGYAWDYALRMARQRPLAGFGQGGFTLAGDAFAVEDVLADPSVFESRIDHVHNEWLETLTDLGAIGFMLVCSVFALTFHAGVRALRGEISSARRWTLIGLLASLAGLIAEECSGVGLRVSEVPIAFFTVLGLTWSVARESHSDTLAWLGNRRSLRASVGFGLLLAALAVFIADQLDFDAARQSAVADRNLRKGDVDAALSAARSATTRLSPQRILTSRADLIAARLASAERIQQIESDRLRRAYDSEIPDQRLLSLAQSDAAVVEEHLKAASGELKQLIAWSPGFINSGVLEYRIHFLRAAAAERRGESDIARALMQSAAAAMERELLRQPFNPALAVAFVRAAIVDPNWQKIVTVLARPLRIGRIAEDYVDTLRALSRRPDFNTAFDVLAEEARRQIEAGVLSEPRGGTPDGWFGERLRLDAVLRFMRGDHAGAAKVLRIAARTYDSVRVSLGAAACHAELAEAVFFSDPSDPRPAVVESRRALALAPDSLQGRHFASIVRQRLIQYHLAADDVDEARRLLRESAPPGVPGEVIERELGVRLRRLCESLLLQRREAVVLLKPAEHLLPRLERWIAQAIEINPDDDLAHFLAADLAMHAGDDAKAVELLRRALELGLRVDDAAAFLLLAREQYPDSKPIESLWQSIESQRSAAQGVPPESVDVERDRASRSPTQSSTP